MEKKLPVIKEERLFSPEKVRTFCIKHKLFTNGTSKEYENLLCFCECNRATKVNIYLVANDIISHSDTEYTAQALMYLLCKDATFTLFKVEERN